MLVIPQHLNIWRMCCRILTFDHVAAPVGVMLLTLVVSRITLLCYSLSYLANLLYYQVICPLLRSTHYHIIHMCCFSSTLNCLIMVWNHEGYVWFFAFAQRHANLWSTLNSCLMSLATSGKLSRFHCRNSGAYVET